MKLSKEVVNRLVLAKSILSSAVGASSPQANSHLVARQLLNAHDAADLVFAAIADQKGKLVTKGRAPSMIECLALLGRKGDRQIAYFKQLNDARNSVKHVGNLPNVHQWSGVAEDVLMRLSELCSSMLGKRLEDISELELVLNADVRAHLETAHELRDLGKHKEGLEEVGKALCVALQEQPDSWDIEVGHPKAEDALKLAALGVAAHEFLRLQEFMPHVSKFLSEPFVVLWEQSKFGHPGNWRPEVVDFCLSQCRLVALRVQTAVGAPHAFELDTLYKYKITAKEDAVELWEDIVDGNLEEIGSNSRPSRSHGRFLAKGDSIEVSAAVRPFISDDMTPSGEWIKRVCVARSDFSIIGVARQHAQFVNLAKVTIVCVPMELGFLLPQSVAFEEVEWEPDLDLRRELAYLTPDSAADSDGPGDDKDGNAL
jgi:hypothetical protein